MQKLKNVFSTLNWKSAAFIILFTVFSFWGTIDYQQQESRGIDAGSRWGFPLIYLATAGDHQLQGLTKIEVCYSWKHHDYYQYDTRKFQCEKYFDMTAFIIDIIAFLLLSIGIYYLLTRNKILAYITVAIILIPTILGLMGPLLGIVFGPGFILGIDL